MGFRTILFFSSSTQKIVAAITSPTSADVMNLNGWMIASEQILHDQTTGAATSDQKGQAEQKILEEWMDRGNLDE